MGQNKVYSGRRLVIASPSVELNRHRYLIISDGNNKKFD